MSVAIEPEDADQIAGRAAEYKELAGKRALRGTDLDQGAEPVHDALHVGVAGGDPDMGTGSWAHHRARSSRTIPSVTALDAPWVSMRAWASSMEIRVVGR
jgi:hypothetical protein